MNEKNYGVIADRLAWEVPLNPSATIELAPFQVFTIGAPEETEHEFRGRPLARSTALSLCVRASPTVAARTASTPIPTTLVLEGHVSLFGEGSRAQRVCPRRRSVNRR